MMADVIAYFVTWTTYGTWLPGDERGWQKWHNGWQRPKPSLAEYSRSIMKEQLVSLDVEQRAIVEATINKHCEIRGWHLWAVHCRSNHVHVVVTAQSASGNTVRDQFKAWCTRYLKAEFDRNRQRWWAEGGYTANIESEDDLAAAIEYTVNAQ